MRDGGRPARLTLEQVRQARITAQARDDRGEFRWMSGTSRTGERVWWRPLPAADYTGDPWVLRVDLVPPETGWVHEQPCACAYCGGAASL